MKLRSAMLAGITLLVVAIIAATVVAVVIVVDRAERRGLRSDLVRSHRVFDDLIAYRASMLRSDCHVVANEPRLRAVVATQDISRETVFGVIAEVRRSLGSDLFLLTDGAGTLVVDALEPAAEGFDLSTNPLIAGALASGDGAGVLITQDRPYQAHACRVDFGAQTVGIITVGRVFDDVVAGTFNTQTGSTLVVALDGKQVASSLDPTVGGDFAPVAVTATKQPSEVVVGSRYVVVGGAFPGYAGKRGLTFALLRSLDEALAPGRQLMWTITGIAAIALGAALVLAFALARRLSHPVAELVAFTRRVGRGALDTRATPQGATEVKALASAMNDMIGEIEKSRRALAETERMERELEIASRIQTSIVPKSFDVLGLDIAARMIPATEVGGDYYDVLPMGDWCWIGIGDVAGHGLSAGLEMLMVQSVVAALVRENPSADPKNHLRVLNHVLYENVRNRLGQDEHITMTLFRFDGETFTFAGAHEEIIVCRAAGDVCERIDTPGPWLGATRDITRVVVDSTLTLAVGDLMVLYSDGITEARRSGGEQFGMDRLCAVIEQHRAAPVETVRDRIIEAVQQWTSVQDDDISLVVVRRVAA